MKTPLRYVPTVRIADYKPSDLICRATRQSLVVQDVTTPSSRSRARALGSGA